MTAAPIQLWTGRTAHVREQPFHRAFSYAVAMIEIDIDRLDEAAVEARLFSVNRFNAIALHTRDHGARTTAGSLRAWAEEQFSRAGVDVTGASIRLLSFPRVLGYGFAPLSLWCAHDQDGELRGVIYEVHNTFGGAHAYVSAIDAGQSRGSAPKEFYVSPFFDVSGDYKFTLRTGQGRMEVIVENTSPEGRKHVASLLLRPRALTDGAILRVLCAMPLSGLGVVFAIHWQALLLWLRGAKFHARLSAPANRTTIVEPATEPVAAKERLRKRA
jgi:DUF1365 family protein